MNVEERLIQVANDGEYQTTLVESSELIAICRVVEAARRFRDLMSAVALGIPLENQPQIRAKDIDDALLDLVSALRALDGDIRANRERLGGAE